MLNQSYLKAEGGQQKPHEILQSLSAEERAFKMLMVHNAKIEKIRKNYKVAYETKQREVLEPAPKPPTDKQSKPKKKTKKNKSGALEVVIKMKGEDGTVETFADEETTLDKENEKKKPPKKKGSSKKGIKKSESAIESEETLDMLMQALKPPSSA